MGEESRVETFEEIVAEMRGNYKWGREHSLRRLEAAHAREAHRLFALIAARDERIRELEAVIRRGVGAIEACAMESRGVPANWEAIDATQDAMRRAVKDA